MSFPENMKDEPAKVTPEPKITETSSLPIPMSNGIDPKPQESEYLHGLQLYLIFLALVIAVLLMMIDVSIVSTALPRITDTFNTIQDQGWYAAGFTFANSALQPMSGKIYSFFPMKISFIVFFAVFELGSLLCATSASSAMFIVGRVVAGLGASGLINGSLNIVTLIAPPNKQPMLLGLIVSITSAGQLLGPFIGGALTQAASWRWCFYINPPCGAITVLFLILIRFPDNSSRRKKFVRKSIIKDFDIIGFLIFIPAVTMCLMALQWGGTKYAWSSATIVGLLVGFAVALLPLCWWEYRQGSNAMFPFPLLRRPVILCACVFCFLAGGALLITQYYLPLWFQTVKGASPLHSAIDTIPSFVTQVLFAVILGILCPRFIPYMTPFAIFGFILNAAGTGAFTSFSVKTPAASWIGFQILSGAGRGLSMQVPVQNVQQHVEKKEISSAIAMVMFFQFFGSAFFLALGQTTFTNSLKSALKHYAPGLDPALVIGSGATDVRNEVPVQYRDGVISAYNTAIRQTFYLALGAALLGVLMSFGLGWKKVEKKAKAGGVGTEKLAPSSKPANA